MSAAVTNQVAASAPRPLWQLVRRAIIATCTAFILILACVVGVSLWLLSGMSGSEASADYGLECGNRHPIDPFGKLPDIADLNEDQVRNAAIVIKVGQDLMVPPRGWVIGVATAFQESRLNNLPHLGPGNDYDSIGLFQQRPSQGWGTREQLADPLYQSRQFFERLLQISDWQTLPLAVAAQRVQLSAYPSAYAKHEPRAATIVDRLTGGAGRASGTVPLPRCAAAGEIATSG